MVTKKYESRFALEDGLAAGRIVRLIFNDGTCKFVGSYKESTHHIKFLCENDDVDLYMLFDKISEYVELETKTIEEKPPVKTKNGRKKKTTTKKSFSIYDLANGKPGKKLSIAKFIEFCRNSKTRKVPNPSYSIKLSDDFVCEGDSKEEQHVLEKLIRENQFKRLRTQCPMIYYAFNGKKDNKYYPDFVLLTNTNKVIIIEVKQLAQMNTKENLAKYKALAKYCKKHGFLYLMCDKKFNVYGRITEEFIRVDVKNAIDFAIDEKGYFGYDDYIELTEGKEHNIVKKIRNSIGKYISTNKKIFIAYGDLTYKIGKLRIKLRRNK